MRFPGRARRPPARQRGRRAGRRCCKGWDGTIRSGHTVPPRRSRAAGSCRFERSWQAESLYRLLFCRRKGDGKQVGGGFDGKTVAISGSGNVAIYACEKAQQLGAKVVTMSDSNGWIYDENGIDLAAVKEIKEVKRGRIKDYLNYHGDAKYTEGRGVWSVNCDIALPCATQNELLEDDAKLLVKNGCMAVCEGANMPTTLEATNIIVNGGLIFTPGKASNAGGVATSALEMSQNSERLSWTFDEVDAKLHNIMINIHNNAIDAAARYGHEGNYIMGANIAGFEKVANAMMAQGIV